MDDRHTDGKEGIRPAVRRAMAGTWKAWRLAVLTALLWPSSAGAQDFFCLDSLMNLGLPLVMIDTVDGEEPACDYVDAPEGCQGRSITNAAKVPGRLRILSGRDTVYDSGPYAEDLSGMTVRMRGNTSAYLVKHSLKVDLQKKADLLRRGDDTFSDKDWLLLADYPPSLNQMVGRCVSRLLGIGWTPEGREVNVVFNGLYRGIFTLSENVKRAPQSRIDVDKSTGFIIERDPYWWNEDFYLETGWTRDTPAFKYTLKYPDSKKVTQEQADYITGVMDRVEQSLADGTYEEYIDVYSFVLWLLAHDILGTLDAAGSNMFFVKYDSSDCSKVSIGPLWDFDSIFMCEDAWSTVKSSGYFPFYDKEGRPTEFGQMYDEVLDFMCQWLFDYVAGYFEDFLHSDEAAALDKSRRYESERWLWPYIPVADDVARIRQWFLSRRDWMMRQTAVHAPRGSVTVPRGIYDLQGRRIEGTPQRGIYIRDGRKYVVR